MSSSSDKVSYGIISDMSESGMCLLTPCPLKNGEEVFLRINNPFSNIAMVRWSGIGSLYYKAGLLFV
jgi:PilZ domain